MVKSFFQACGYHISKIDTISCFEPCLYNLLKRREKVLFIQIGANDGKMVDSIYQFIKRNHTNVRGIVIEPMRDVFEQLKNNYRKFPNITPVNIAIHNSKKEMLLYRVDPAKLKQLPEEAKGIASFNKDHHKLSNTPSDVIIAEKVNCISLEELCKDYQFTKIDLLQIDTEGYDADIILNIRFDIIKPSIIRFEHGLPHGVMSSETFLTVVDLLHRNGYELIIESYDAIAYQPNIIVDL
jgi:FkbM family methyltransferase